MPSVQWFRRLRMRPILEWLVPAAITLAVLAWVSTPQLDHDLSSQQGFATVDGTPVTLGDPEQPWSPSLQTCLASESLLTELGVEIAHIPFPPPWPECSGDETVMIVEHWPGGVFLWDREHGFVLTWAQDAPP